jgi:hypothetical protein
MPIAPHPEPQSELSKRPQMQPNRNPALINTIFATSFFAATPCRQPPTIRPHGWFLT